MKLRKQTPAKAVVVALTAGFMAALFALVRSEPRIKAASSESTDRPAAVDYQRFFAPASPPGATNPPAVPPVLPHTRTRAS